jgi:hypothetical protein
MDLLEKCCNWELAICQQTKKDNSLLWARRTMKIMGSKIQLQLENTFKRDCPFFLLKFIFDSNIFGSTFLFHINDLETWRWCFLASLKSS